MILLHRHYSLTNQQCYNNQSWAFAHTVRKLRCALSLFSGLRNLGCAFTKQFAIAQFSL